MMNGTSVLEGYVPDVDATIVTQDSGCRRLHHSARRYARACASPAAAIRRTPGRSAIPMTTRALPEDPPAAARRWSHPERWTWPSVATKGGRSGYRPAGAASTDSSQPTGWSPIHRGLPNRTNPGPYGADGTHRRRRGAVAGSSRRPRWTGPQAERPDFPGKLIPRR